MIILMKCKRFDDNSVEDKTLSGFDDNQSNHNHQHSNHQHVIINGKQYWIPKVPDEVKPELKGHYKSYEDIIDMHYKYALAAGSNVRKTTNRKNAQRIIRLRYLVCNRQAYILPLFRYDMVFVPFTGIYIHKKYVTFGDRLLSKEDIDLYTWLLKSFMKAFGKQPILVLSDQDPTMKNSIANVFPDSIHRLCMRHITSKLPLKVTIFHLISFQSTLHSL
uniref:MULE transposase domain-containing protein n=1 Tax=Lactuca sativa TaxID=4236 RepID=A0A9R1V9G2_LACSA|nr:hypothetical protein LSAT_V11C600321050 [Lactuca sativa]